MGNRNNKVLDELRRGPLTPLECLNMLGIMRLAAAVFDLKAQGHQIRTEMVDVLCREGRTARVARYHLMPDGAAPALSSGAPEAQGGPVVDQDTKQRVIEVLAKLGPSGATADELRVMTQSDEQPVAAAMFALRVAGGGGT